MKKNNHYTPYLFAFVITAFFSIANGLVFKQGFLLFWIAAFILIVGLWYWIEWILTLTDKKFVRWSSVVLGSILYILTILSLDFYYFHYLINFTGNKPLNTGIGCFIIAIVATILIESIHWSKAREKAAIDNLRLQAENIEAKFQLLKKQINPDFLFHCLTTLQKMIKADAPQTEDFILKLADVYRQTLNNNGNVRRLREELDLFNSYMFLMRYGREDVIVLSLNISDTSLGYRLPVFALQLLGDNCIKHNTFSKSQPLHIRVFQKDTQSITISHSNHRKDVPDSFDLDITHLDMRYALEGIDNGVWVDNETLTYSTTLKLF